MDLFQVWGPPDNYQTEEPATLSILSPSKGPETRRWVFMYTPGLEDRIASQVPLGVYVVVEKVLVGVNPNGFQEMKFET